MTTLIQEIEDYLRQPKPDLKTDTEEIFGQFQPDLILSADQDEAGDQEALDQGDNPRLCYQEAQKAHWHTTKAVDHHYYQSAGIEPVQEPVDFYRGLWNLLGWWMPVLGLIAFVVYCLVWGR